VPLLHQWIPEGIGWLVATRLDLQGEAPKPSGLLAEADVILMVVGLTTGGHREDLAAAKVIRRAGPPVRLVVNKVDDTNREAGAW